MRKIGEWIQSDWRERRRELRSGRYGANGEMETDERGRYRAKKGATDSRERYGAAIERAPMGISLLREVLVMEQR